MLPLFGHADIDEQQRFCNSGPLGPQSWAYWNNFPQGESGFCLSPVVPPPQLDGFGHPWWFHRPSRHIMGLLSGYGHARRKWKCHVSPIVLCQSNLCRHGTFYHAHDCGLVCNCKAIFSLTCPWSLRAPCERPWGAGYPELGKSRQSPHTPGLGVRSTNQKGCLPCAPLGIDHNHTLTSHPETKGVLTPKTKGVALPNDHKRSVKRNVARSKTTHKRAKIDTKASMDYSDLVPDNSKAPYQQTQMNGANRRQRLTKPFKTKGGPKGDQLYLRGSSKQVQTPKHRI